MAWTVKHAVLGRSLLLTGAVARRVRQVKQDRQEQGVRYASRASTPVRRGLRVKHVRQASRVFAEYAHNAPTVNSQTRTRVHARSAAKASRVWMASASSVRRGRSRTTSVRLASTARRGVQAQMVSVQGARPGSSPALAETAVYYARTQSCSTSHEGGCQRQVWSAHRVQLGKHH